MGVVIGVCFVWLDFVYVFVGFVFVVGGSFDWDRA